jgi:hypothetical protein
MGVVTARLLQWDYIFRDFFIWVLIWVKINDFCIFQAEIG